LHRPVTRKLVLDPEIAAMLGGERFLREVDLASKLTHPHILPIHAAGEADERPTPLPDLH
jgi:serine/threonine-protein kinase